MYLEPGEEIAQQLNCWAKGKQDIASSAVKNSDFYREMQTTSGLIVDNLKLTQGSLLLLGDIVARSPSLTSLKIVGVKIGSNAKKFGEALTRSKSLTLVDVSHNNLDDSDATIFLKPMAHSESLTSLDMSSNQLGIYDKNPLGVAIANLPFLAILNLSNNNLYRNIKAFVDDIAKSPSLKELNLSDNHIGDTVSLVKKLAYNSNITTLVGYQDSFDKIQSPKRMTAIKFQLEAIFPDAIASIVTDYIGCVSYHEIDMVSGHNKGIYAVGCDGFGCVVM